MPALMLLWGHNTTTSPSRRSSFLSQPSLYGSNSTLHCVYHEQRTRMPSVSQSETESPGVAPPAPVKPKSRSMSNVGVVHCGKRKCSDCTPTLSLRSLLSPKRNGVRRYSTVDTTFGGRSPAPIQRRFRTSSMSPATTPTSSRTRNSLSPPPAGYSGNHMRSSTDLGRSLCVPGEVIVTVKISSKISSQNL